MSAKVGATLFFATWFALSGLELAFGAIQLPGGPKKKPAKADARQVEFRTDIMPLLSRYGCNTAECHGAATGQGDLKLSLFGGDWKKDYRALVNELQGRRVNLVRPGKSLLVTKPTELLSHGGGERFDADSKPAETLRRWIAQGASDRSTRVVSSIQVSPQKVIVRDGQSISIRVTAKTKSGSSDVTDQVKFLIVNPQNVQAESHAKFIAKRPGRHFVIVEYLSFAERVEFVRPFPNQAPRKKGNSKTRSTLRPPASSIDQLISHAAKTLNIAVPQPVSDSMLVRRLYLDLLGRLPTENERQQFLKAKDHQTRLKIVDALLASDDFQVYWTYWLRKTIHFRLPGNNLSSAKKMNRWLGQVIREDRGWDRFAKQVLISMGDTEKNPQANYHRFFADARGQAESVASTFLGVRIGCANCHRHPLDRWTQEDYHGLAAIFASLKRGPVVADFPKGSVIQPKTGEPAIPKIPGQQKLRGNSSSQRQQFADWLVQQDPFADAMVNRIWKKLMGRGLVEPVDDFRIGNPPIDPKLLVHLRERFKQTGYRLKPFIRSIVSSQIYASAPIATPSPQSMLAGYFSKPLKPEVYRDISRRFFLPEEKFETAISSLRPERLDGSLGLLKGCTEKNCQMARTNPQMGLREKLHLINGAFINRWIDDPKNWIHQQFKQGESPMTIMEQAYLRSLCRKLTDKERQFWKQFFSKQRLNEERRKFDVLTDAIWALMNLREFRSIN